MANKAANADRLQLLLVDDQPARLLSYRTILEPLDENLVEAQSGTEALGRLMESEFAVILLDVNMPGMDGFEAASLIHEHPRFEKTPIIFVTAINVSDLDRLRGYDLGAVDYVTVPVIPEILRSKVAVLCELFRKRRDLQELNRYLAAANEELRVEKNREVYKLNETLRDTIAELTVANANLQSEIAVRRRAEERLTEADRRKDEFLATLAHELRNPLAPIQSALNVHKLEAGADARGQSMGIIERQVLLLSRLVDDLLDVARITRGKLTLRKEQVLLRDVLKAAIETTGPLVEAAGQVLLTDIPEQDVLLFADAQRLSQVFANVLNNACKYSPANATISLGARREDGQALVSIRDSGIGLSPEECERIFDLFVQVDASLERARGGLGIGLTLVRQLVEMHGGRIRVHSEGLGRGSEFVISVPVAEGIEAAAAGPALAAPATRNRSLRILVVDDNCDGADMLALTLGILGHQVSTVYEPLKALAAAASFLPDVAFLDIGMPALNGYQLAEMIRREPWASQLMLVALTGWGQEENRIRSAAAGFDEHLVKPVELETIHRICEHALTRPSTEAAASGIRHGN